MKRYYSSLLLIAFLLFSCSNEKKHDQLQKLPELHERSTVISFTATDDVLVYGDLVVSDKSQPTIILFHQGGSNARGEYLPIVPKLVEKGYNILAVDQRQGGQTYGSYNRTVAELNESYSYCDTYRDLKSALDYVINKGFSEEIFVWGSSYSGSLAVKLASENPDKISGVLAFSPASGGPMADCKADLYLDDLSVPLVVFRPTEELKIESAKAQFGLLQEKGFQVYEAEIGVHGSSMLAEERAGGNVDTNWEAVFSFIEETRSY